MTPAQPATLWWRALALGLPLYVACAFATAPTRGVPIAVVLHLGLILYYRLSIRIMRPRDGRGYWYVAAALALALGWRIGRMTGGHRVDDSFTCRSNLTTLRYALFRYADAHDGRLPGPHWFEEINKEFPTGTLHCPEVGSRGGYAMSINLQTMRLRDIPQPHKTVLLYESTAAGTTLGSGETLPKNPPHPEGYCVLMADGHVRFVSRQQMQFARLTPLQMQAANRLNSIKAQGSAGPKR